MESAPFAPALIPPVPAAAGSTSGSGSVLSAGPTAGPSNGCNNELTVEIVRLRQDISQLHSSVSALTAAIAALAGSPPHSRFEPPEERRPPMASASPATLLALRSGERLNGEVQRRLRLGGDADSDTELDLLIDRLHDLSDAGS
jgi:hypothetical protein